MNKNEFGELLEEYLMVDEKGSGFKDLIKRSAHTIWRKKWYLCVSLGITLVISAIFSYNRPDYYHVKVKIVPELSSGSSSSSGVGGLLKSLSSNAGGSEEDAIEPILYPDLMDSKKFLVSMFNVPVVSRDEKINTTYYEYLSKFQKSSLWNRMIGGMANAVGSWFTSEKKVSKKSNTSGAFAPTAQQAGVMSLISSRVKSDMDKKSGVITIQVTDQDPIICATIADTACVHLQQFITEYRTKKARQELANIEKQYQKARKEYEASKADLESYSDSNWDLVDEDFLVEKQALQNEMQLKFSTLSAFNTQLLAARTKLESSQPVYTVLDGSSVPLKPSGPRKTLMVIMWLFIIGVLHSLWLVRKDIAGA